jgi:hypothetical protein
MPRADVAHRPPIETVPGPALRAARELQVGGLSRRSLLRLGIGAAVGVWFTEMVGGTAAFIWSAVSLTPQQVRVGTLADLVATNPGIPIREGFPVYVEAAAAFVVLVDPGRGDWRPGSDPTGEGLALNVRALSKRCPHLGCRPNPCPEDFWFHCPCHQSRYDRLGIKPAGERYGPAARGMDRFAVSVDADGVLTIDTGHVTLGPLPIALGQPGVIPPLTQNACV